MSVLTDSKYMNKEIVELNKGTPPPFITALITHPHLVLRLRKEWSYTSTPPLGLRGLF
jgi:hypothetical protein